MIQATKINLAIDANEANVKKRVGSGQYTYNLLSHWYNTTKDIAFHLYLKNSPLPDMPHVKNNWHYHIVRPDKFWLNFSLPAHLAFKKPPHQVFFAPAHYSSWYMPYPLVVTIHDLAYEYFPDQFLKKDLYKLKNWTLKSISRAVRVIAVSQNTAKDLIEKYQVSANKITVIYNGYDKTRFNAKIKPNSSIFYKYSIPQNTPYLLFVGTLQPRKNLTRLVTAYSLLKLKYKLPHKLVIAGNPGWMSDNILSHIHHSPLSQDIILTGYVEHKDLPSLYKLADVFVLPSLYEGFGIPALEAMAVGTPVAVSNTSSLPEVVGRAGVLFDPYQPEDIALGIKTALERKQSLRKLGFLQVRKFSWAKTARQTLDVLIKKF